MHPTTPQDHAEWLEAQADKCFATPGYMTHLEASGYHAFGRDYLRALENFRKTHPTFGWTHENAPETLKVEIDKPGAGFFGVDLGLRDDKPTLLFHLSIYGPDNLDLNHEPQETTDFNLSTTDAVELARHILACVNAEEKGFNNV